MFVPLVGQPLRKVTTRPALPITSVKRAQPLRCRFTQNRQGTPLRTQDLLAASAKSHPQVANCPQSADGALGESFEHQTWGKPQCSRSNRPRNSHYSDGFFQHGNGFAQSARSGNYEAPSPIRLALLRALGAGMFVHRVGLYCSERDDSSRAPTGYRRDTSPAAGSRSLGAA